MRSLQIIGGGLAGLSLGISLRRQGVPVTLSEAGSYPRHRVCGEFISGVSEETLRSLGILDLLDQAVRAENCAWFDEDKLLLECSLPRAARSISRFVLDEALATRFTALGGVLQTGVRIGDLPTREGVVFSTGRKREASPWVGLKMHVKGMELVTDLEMHVTSYGYVGLNKISHDHVNICGLFLKNHVKGAGNSSLLQTIRAIGLEKLFHRLQGAEYISNSFCAVSGFRLGWQTSSAENELTLGDASAMIAPFTGNGMSMAFEGAEIACQTLVDYARGETEWDEAVKKIRLQLSKTFARRLFVSRLSHPFLLHRVLFRSVAWLGRIEPAAFHLAYDGTRS